MAATFAICAHVDTDTLIVDEVLSVGDGVFRQKCSDFIAKFCASGTLILASNETELILALCDRVIWIDSGAVQTEGTSAAILPRYMEESGIEPDSGLAFGS